MSYTRTSVPLKNKFATGGHNKSATSGHNKSATRGHNKSATSGHNKPETLGHVGEADTPQEKLKNEQPTGSLPNGTPVGGAVMPPSLGPDSRTHTNPVTENTTTEVKPSSSLPHVSASGPSQAAAGDALNGASPSWTLSVAEIPSEEKSEKENPPCANDGCGNASIYLCQGGCGCTLYCSQVCSSMHWAAGHHAICNAMTTAATAAVLAAADNSSGYDFATHVASSRPAPAATAASSHPAPKAAAAKSSHHGLCPHMWKDGECPNKPSRNQRGCPEGAHMQLCKFYKIGKCTLGQKCTFIHRGEATAASNSKALYKEAQERAKRAKRAAESVAAVAAVEAPTPVLTTNPYALLDPDAPVRRVLVVAPAAPAAGAARGMPTYGSLAAVFGRAIGRAKRAGRLQLSTQQHWHAMTIPELLEYLNAKDLEKFQRNPSGPVYVPVRANDPRLTERSALGLCPRAISHLLNSSRGLESEQCKKGCNNGLTWDQRSRVLLDLVEGLLNGTETYSGIINDMISVIQSGAASLLLANPHVREWDNMDDVPKLGQADTENLPLIFKIIMQCIKVARNPKVRDGWKQLGKTPETAYKYIAFMQLFAPMCPRSVRVGEFLLENKPVPANHICKYTCDTCVMGTHVPLLPLAEALKQGDSMSVVRDVKVSNFAPIRLCIEDAVYGKCSCNRALSDEEHTAIVAMILDDFRAASIEREQIEATLRDQYGTTVVSECEALKQEQRSLKNKKDHNSRCKSNSKKQQDKGVTVWTSAMEAKLVALNQQILEVGATDAKAEVRALRERYNVLSSIMHELAVDFFNKLFPLFHGTTDMGQVALMDDPTFVSLKPKVPFSCEFNESGLQAKVMSAESKAEREELRRLLQSLKRGWAPVARLSKLSNVVINYQFQLKKEIWNSDNESDQAERERLHAMYRSFEAFVANRPRWLDVEETGDALDLAREAQGRPDFDEYRASKPQAGTTFADWIALNPVRSIALAYWRESKQAVAWEVCKSYVRLGLTAEVMPLAKFATYNPATVKSWLDVNQQRKYFDINLRPIINAKRADAEEELLEPLGPLTIEAFIEDQPAQVMYFTKGGRMFCENLATFKEAIADGWKFVLKGTYKTLTQEGREAFVDNLAAMAMNDSGHICSLSAQIEQGRSITKAVGAFQSAEERVTCMQELGVTEANLAAIPLMIQSNEELIAAVEAKVYELKEAAAKEAPKAPIAKAAVAAARVKRAEAAEVNVVHLTAKAFFQEEDRFAGREVLCYRIGTNVVKHAELPSYDYQPRANGEPCHIGVFDVTEDAWRRGNKVNVRSLGLGPLATRDTAKKWEALVRTFASTASMAINPRVVPYFGDDGDEEGYFKALAECKALIKQMLHDNISGTVTMPCAALFGGCYMVQIPFVKSKNAERGDKQAFKRSIATEDWAWVRGLIEFIAPKLGLQPCDFWTNMRSTESTRTWLESVKRVNESDSDESESDSDESDDDSDESDDDSDESEFESDDDEPVSNSRLFARPTSTKKAAVAVAAPAPVVVPAPVAQKVTKPGQQKRQSPEEVMAHKAAAAKAKKDAEEAAKAKKEADAAAKAAAFKAKKEADAAAKAKKEAEAAAPKPAAPAPKPAAPSRSPVLLVRKAGAVVIKSAAAKPASAAAKPAAAAAAPQPAEEEEEEFDDEEDEVVDEEDLYHGMHKDGNVRVDGKKGGKK